MINPKTIETQLLQHKTAIATQRKEVESFVPKMKLTRRQLMKGQRGYIPHRKRLPLTGQRVLWKRKALTKVRETEKKWKADWGKYLKYKSQYEAYQERLRSRSRSRRKKKKIYGKFKVGHSISVDGGPTKHIVAGKVFDTRAEAVDYAGSVTWRDPT